MAKPTLGGYFGDSLPGMNRALKKRTETALDELARTYELVRGLLIQRLEDIDTGTVRKRGSEYAGKMASRLDDIDTKRLQRRGYKYAGALRKNVERRMRPEPRRAEIRSTTALHSELQLRARTKSQ